MKNKRVVFFVLALLFCSGAVAQKIKYKDIFDLLEKKQYDAAEPLLKQYLEKEFDNPNAFLYLGIIKMEKYYKILPQDASAAKKEKDEAIKLLERAKFNIDKKEIARNERYYSAYRRRNLRSGVFEVALSDVFTDIDKRIEKLKTDQ